MIYLTKKLMIVEVPVINIFVLLQVIPKIWSVSLRTLSCKIYLQYNPILVSMRDSFGLFKKTHTSSNETCR